MSLNSGNKPSRTEGECLEDAAILDHDQVIEAIRHGELRTIPEDFCFDYGDYPVVNKLRRRRTYVKTEVSEEHYTRLKMLARREDIPIRHIVTRAVELYLNEFVKYGGSERGILINITPFDD